MSSIHRDRIRKRQRFLRENMRFNHKGYFGYCLKNPGKWWRLSRMDQMTPQERWECKKAMYTNKHRRKAARASNAWLGKWLMGAVRSPTALGTMVRR